MKLKPEARSQKPEVRSAISAGRALARGRTMPSGFSHQLSTINYQPAERGIALVITLILLSVTLFMAVAFLAISRRERGSVVTETDTVTARLAADSALANAEAQILATVLQTTNPYNFGLLVSTNYQNANGYFIGSQNPTNVNYDFRTVDGLPLNAADFVQNVANLWYLPRAPVFAYDRTTGTNEFRFYLDLNRNRQFDANGRVPNVDNLGFTNNFMQAVGDPEWIGVLERPDAPHGPNNKFLSRYAFIAMPAGNTLDLNGIHNEVQAPANLNASGGANDGFFRNQGVGSWEINLAAFLADLNMNEWGQTIGNSTNGNTTYYFYQYLNGNNRGRAFDDARALLAYRYNHNYNSLASFSTLFPNYPLAGRSVDMFPLGSLMTNSVVPFYNYSLNNSWPGADNTNRYFSLASDLFDSSKITAPALNFMDHLQEASTNTFGGSTVSTYDRYTFYRLLAQLGTDSAPESGKLNLNYVNVDDSGNIVPNMETNLIPWTNSIKFFTNAADRMLHAYTKKWFQAGPSNYLATYYGIHYPFFIDPATGSGLVNPLVGTNTIPTFGIANIPVLISNRFVYQPAVQRVLQLAANIYDATTNTFYPSRFRPTFTKVVNVSTTNVFISGYDQQVNVFQRGFEFLPGSSPGAADIDTPIEVSELPVGQNIKTNIYGIPWVIGVKKGFPNFNEFSMESAIQITRKLQFNRNTNTTPASQFTTNQMYVMNITNFYGLECWNSYLRKPYYTGATGNSGPVVIAVRNYMTMTLTNENGYTYPKSATNWLAYPLNIWPSNYFVVPLNTYDFLFTNAVYFYNNPSPPNYHGFGGTFDNYADSGIAPLPQFGFLLTNNLQVAIIDYSAGLNNGQIIDYVNLNGLTGSRDVNSEFADTTLTGLWSTNYGNGNLPAGVVNQYYTSRNGLIPAEDTDDGFKWANAQVPGLPSANGVNTSPKAEQIYFQAFFSANNSANYLVGNQGYTVVNNLGSMQAPFTITRTRVKRLTWQANDPLVHHVASDLVDTVDDTNIQKVVDWPANLGALNTRYMPWGNTHTLPPGSDLNPYNFAYRDSLVQQSDDWDFPTNKFPTVGWLGRVHRGTPWQTVFLKATNILELVQNLPLAAGNGLPTWKNWTGNFNSFDATNTAPVQDRILFDVFTTALNDNATRGQLPVNVCASDVNNPLAGLAAWSAVFGGVVVPTNLVGVYNVIDPAGTYGVNSTLGQMVTNINYTRTHLTNDDGVIGAFEHVGDVLKSPLLTERSSFLYPSSITGLNPKTQISDAMYEWLPQQTMSLLRLGDQPRFVIYSYGQTLTPAPNGVVNSGGLAGMITNYQVTAETVTRSVVRIEGAPTNSHAVIESFNVLPAD